MASKIGKALGFSMDSGDETPREKKLGMSEGDIPFGDTSPDEMDSDSDKGEDASPDSGSMTLEKDKGPMGPEEIAMKMFSRAKSPSEQVAALKAFGEACGWGGSSDMGY